MGEEPRTKPDQPFKIGDLERLNEELKQLREILKKKRAERDKARREGRRLQVDLTPEIERLGRFLTEVERVSQKLKENPPPRSSPKPTQSDGLGNILGKVKAEIEGEKKKLEAEREAREEERAKHEQELQLLRDEVSKNKELLNQVQTTLGTAVSRVIERSEDLQGEPQKLDQTKKAPTTVSERPPSIAQTVDSTAKAKASPEVQLESQPEPKRADQVTKDFQAHVTDEFSAMKSELQRLREQLSREQESLDAKRRELDLERKEIEEDRRTLHTSITETFTATRSELERLKEETSRKQEVLEEKQRELYEEKAKIDEERRLLKERAADVENDRLRYNARKMMEELQNERSELTRLKKSLQELRTESSRDRRRLEKDRDSILRARISLEKEKRKAAWKNNLLEIKGRSALIAQKDIPKTDKLTKHLKEREKREVEGEENSSTDDTSQSGAVVLGVRLGEETYGIDIKKVREIMKRQPITPVPRQPPYVEGVMNVRGDIIPVVNLRRRFDLKGEPSGDLHTVIVDSAQGMVGILVDSVSEVMRLTQETIHPAPQIVSGFEGEYLQGICRVGDQLLLYLDVEKILRKATPIDMLQAAHMGAPNRKGKWLLSSDEQKLLKAIPTMGIPKSRLKRKVKFGDERLGRVVASLARKRLVRTYRDGTRRIISRVETTHRPQ